MRHLIGLDLELSLLLGGLDFFQICLRNTNRIFAQYNAALFEINETILQALADFDSTLPDGAVHATGDKDTDIEIDDDD